MRKDDADLPTPRRCFWDEAREEGVVGGEEVRMKASMHYTLFPIALSLFGSFLSSIYTVFLFSFLAAFCRRRRRDCEDAATRKVSRKSCFVYMCEGGSKSVQCTVLYRVGYRETEAEAMPKEYSIYGMCV